MNSYADNFTQVTNHSQNLFKIAGIFHFWASTFGRRIQSNQITNIFITFGIMAGILEKCQTVKIG